MSAYRGQDDERIIAHRGYRFQRHMPGALDGSLVVLLDQQGTDQSDDGVVVRKDANDLGAPLDVVVEAFDRACRTKFRPITPGKDQSRFSGTRANSIFSRLISSASSLLLAFDAANFFFQSLSKCWRTPRRCEAYANG